jgi:diguanylate cyclase (GGDEF)-like protein
MQFNHLKIKEKITQEFKKKYIDNFYKALLIVVSIISIVEIFIGITIMNNGGEPYEIFIAATPALLNFTGYFVSSYLNKNANSVNKQIDILSSYYLFACAVYCFFTIRFDFLIVTVLAQIIILIPFDKKTLFKNFMAGILLIIVYTTYQVLMHKFKVLSAYPSNPKVYIFISSIVLSIYIAMYFTCKEIQKLIYIISEKVVESVIDADNASNKLMYDHLTNLFNEVKLLNDIKEIDYKSIAYIDIDDFKSINDTYGHDIGDKTLIKFAESFSGKHCVLYRIHGDEFVVLSHFAKEELKKYLELKQLIFLQKMVNELGFEATVSIGITDFESNENIVKKADELLYNSKKNGKNIITIS